MRKTKLRRRYKKQRTQRRKNVHQSGAGDFVNGNCTGYPVLTGEDVKNPEFVKTFFEYAHPIDSINLERTPNATCAEGSYNEVCKVRCKVNGKGQSYILRRQKQPLPAEPAERTQALREAYTELLVNVQCLPFVPFIYMAGVVEMSPGQHYVFQVTEEIVPFNDGLRKILSKTSSSAKQDTKIFLEFYQKALDVYEQAAKVCFMFDIKVSNLGIRGLNSSEREVVLLDTDTSFMIDNPTIDFLIELVRDEMHIEGTPNFDAIRGVWMKFLFAAITLMSMPIKREYAGQTYWGRYITKYTNVFEEEEIAALLMSQLTPHHELLWKLNEALLDTDVFSSRVREHFGEKQFQDIAKNILNFKIIFNHYILSSEENTAKATKMGIISRTLGATRMRELRSKP